MKRKFHITISAIVVILSYSFLSRPSSAASPAAADSLAIGGYTQTNELHVSTYEYEYTYTAVITNKGPSVKAVVAVLNSLDPNLKVIDGTLTLGDIPGNGSRASQNTFTIRYDVRYPWDSSKLSWRISFLPGTKTAEPPTSFADSAQTS